MSVSIELPFDHSAAAICLGIWRRLERELDCRPLSRGVARPHVSLALVEDPLGVDFEAIVAAVGRAAQAFELGFVAASTFDSDEGVIFLVPEPSDSLRRCHALVQDGLAGSMAPSNPLYTTGRWVPHCTVAIDVPLELRSKAVSIAAEALPISAHVATIRAFDYEHGVSRAEHALCCA